MKKVGNVVLILNDKTTIIRATEPLILGSEVLVYTEIQLGEEAKSKSGMNNVTIPKGKLKIIMLQENNYYLASIITKNNSINSQENQNLGRNLTLYQSIFDKNTAPDVNVSNGETAEYSAKLDKTQSINAKFSHLVVVGDHVSFQQTQN